MNKKSCITWLIAACLIGAGIAANGYFISQQGVYYMEAQEESFLRAMQSAPNSLDPSG